MPIFFCSAIIIELTSLMKASKVVKKLNQNKPVVGFILCGWNFVSGPFDKKSEA